MKVLFIKPRWQYPYSPNDSTYNRIWPPLSLLYCAGLLKKHGIDSSIEDIHADRVSEAAVVKSASGYDKIFVTSSSLDRWQCPPLDVAPVVRACRQLKKKGTKLYVMGYHGSVNPRKMLDLTAADAVIKGEPEATVAGLCLNSRLEQVPGAAYYDSCGRFKENKDREHLDISLLPCPDYSLINTKKYFYEVLGGNFALFEGSRGCSYSCSFCDKVMHGHKRRAKLPGRLFSEIERTVKNYKVKNGYIIDLNFSDDKRFVHEFCARLIKNKLRFKWCCQARIDSVDRDILNLMKKAGCRLIHYGIETGSEAVMKSMNKRLLFDSIHKNIGLTKKAGIKSACFFMTGFKDSPDPEARSLYKLAKKLSPDYASFHVYADYKRIFREQNFRADIDKERQLLRKKMLLCFYFRPKFLVSRLRCFNIKLALRQLFIFLKTLLLKG